MRKRTVATLQPLLSSNVPGHIPLQSGFVYVRLLQLQKSLTITASISFSSKARAGVCQNRFGRSCTSSATSLVPLPPDARAPDAEVDDEDENDDDCCCCSSFSGRKCGPDEKACLKCSKSLATSPGAAGCGCGVCSPPSVQDGEGEAGAGQRCEGCPGQLITRAEKRKDIGELWRAVLSPTLH